MPAKKLLCTYARPQRSHTHRKEGEGPQGCQVMGKLALPRLQETRSPTSKGPSLPTTGAVLCLQHCFADLAHPPRLSSNAAISRKPSLVPQSLHSHPLPRLAHPHNPQQLDLIGFLYV